MLIRIIILLFLVLYPIPYFLTPVYAAPCDPKNSKPEDCPAGLDQIEQVFTSVISAVVGLGFIAMLVLLVVAGIKYLTSGGEPKAIQSAHDTVTWALLGVLFLAIAWLILQLIGVFTGVEVTSFNIRVLCGPNGDWCKNP